MRVKASLFLPGPGWVWFVLNGLLRLIGEEGTYFLLSSLGRSNYGSTVAHLTTFLFAWKCHAAGNGGCWLSSSVLSPAPYKNSGSAWTTMVSLWYGYGNASYSCSSPPFVLPQSEPELSKAPPLGHLQSCLSTRGSGVANDCLVTLV